MKVLKVKVLSNFLILELLNCSENMEDALDKLVEAVGESVERDRASGLALFRMVVRSLFGF